MKQEEVDVFKIGFKVVGESANGGKTIMRTVWLVRSITSPWKLGNLPLLCRKTIWIKPGSVFKKMRHFWGNPWPTLGKSVTDFEEIRHRFWGNQPPILGKSATGFGEIRHWIGGNPSLNLGICFTELGEIRHWIGGNPSLNLGKNWLGFRERLVRF